ncbi:hypothetical protein [Mesorhizobium kowhaii]|uniref:Uncharacterized protein n=1 Tax=Mesorhizobium kowhaii TaxID=1300272 RepID=A0A2W7BV65_9HYPH|nr:hypothetical protein [Mesorhizobium kowhaii]PZV34467.1 hypothetical protein B5V02_32445 [Mesorhizobium kowhaii]
MDCFEKIEALVDAASADAIDRARVLLDQFDDKSQTIAQAIDDFLLDLMTLVFVIESTQEMFHYPARRLAHLKLTRIRLLLAS